MIPARRIKIKKKSITYGLKRIFSPATRQTCKPEPGMLQEFRGLGPWMSRLHKNGPMPRSEIRYSVWYRPRRTCHRKRVGSRAGRSRSAEGQNIGGDFVHASANDLRTGAQPKGQPPSGWTFCCEPTVRSSTNAIILGRT